jgi:hypothetical protein
MLIAVVTGLSAAALLLSAGYIFGARRGARERERLREQCLLEAEAAHTVRERLAYEKATAEALRDSTGQMIGNVENLRSIVHDVLGPLARREQLAYELSRLDAGAGRRGELSSLLDQIAEKGGFRTVLLSDDAGLPLASNSHGKDLDRLAATASLVLLFVDRIRRDGSPAPLSLMLQDEANQVTLCRIFSVGDQRLLLTAVAIGVPLTPMALDAALPKLENALTG